MISDALRVVVAVDPGQTGALAFYVDGEPSGFLDMPTVEREKGGGRQVDGRRLAELLRETLRMFPGAHVVAVIERVQAIGGKGVNGPRSSPTSAFRFGQADGIARGVLEALGMRLVEVEPQCWKKHHGLIGSEKDAARHLALGRWPRIGMQLLQVKHGGRADALLIAAWAHETEAWIPAPPVAKPRVRRKPKAQAA